MKKLGSYILLFVFYISYLTPVFTGAGFSVFAQVPTQQWVARYQSPTSISGLANKMALDKVGNCYIFGEFLSIYNDVVLVKYNSTGDSLWSRAYQGPGNEIPYGVVADSIGNCYVTFSSGPDFGPYDVVTIKYDAQGLQQWLKIYDTGINDEPRDIAIDIQGNVYICGISGNQSLIIKYNPSGDTVWTRRYTEPGFRFPSITITLDSKNNVYIGGGKINISIGSQNYYTIKYDSAGQFKWVTSYSLVGIANLTKVRTDLFCNVFVTGRSINGKILTIKYDSTGAEQWQRIYDGTGSGSDVGRDLAIDKLGNIIVAGTSTEAGTATDYITIKYNTLGDSLWVRKYNGTGNAGEELRSMVLDDSDNVYVTGRSLNAGSSDDYLSIKYNSSGLQQWLVRYPSAPNSGGIACVIRVDRFRNVYVTGISDSSNVSGYVTIKYSQPVGIVNLSNNLPIQFLLFQNYPNPFNPSTNIKYQITKSGHVKLVVFNILGSELAVLVDQYQTVGTYKADFNASNYSTGVYFYRLTTEVFTDAKKMILLK